MRPLFLSAGVAVLMWPFAAAAGCFTSEEAQNHVGENGCVCGIVASTHYAAHSKSQPTFLNLDKPYPNQIFAAVIL